MILLLSWKKMLIDVFLDLPHNLKHPHPHDLSFHLSVTRVRFCVHKCVFVDHPHLSLQSLEWLNVNTASQRCHTRHMSKYTQVKRGGEVQRVKNQSTYSHFLLFIFSFFPRHTHTFTPSYCVSSPLLYTHAQTYSSDLNLKVRSQLHSWSEMPWVEFANASCVNYNLCMRWTSKLCLIFCKVTFLVNPPVVWSVKWYKHIHLQLCVVFFLSALCVLCMSMWE